VIIQVDDPPSSVLLQRRTKDGREYVLMTQIRGVHFTKLHEFDAYFNELGKGEVSATRRVVDSNFVILPVDPLRDYLEGSEE
jgi:hypothetical protein